MSSLNMPEREKGSRYDTGFHMKELGYIYREIVFEKSYRRPTGRPRADSGLVSVNFRGAFGNDKFA